MAIPTSRTRSRADIAIDEDKCTGCGLCVSVCKDFSLEMTDGKIRVSETPLFGCIACGHCMAICPAGAIEITGRTLSPGDLFDLPEKEKRATHEQLSALLAGRRSIREFKDLPVEEGLVAKILEASRTAPMGLPPSDVNVMVFDTKEKVRDFAGRFCAYLEGMKWLVSDWFLLAMRPFWGRANDELFRNFLRPLIHVYTQNIRRDVNLVTYDAPLAIYFYGSPYSDPADPIVAATYAMLAGESLGLGTCMVGSIHPLIQIGRRARRFRKEQGIKYPSREGLFVIFGYPDVKYRKGIRRTFASTEVYGSNQEKNESKRT